MESSSGGRLFDVYIAVDWSATGKATPKRPTRDAIWVGEATGSEDAPAAPVCATYWRTRSACSEHLRSRLLKLVAEERRVLVCFDFSYGYPAGFAAALGLTGEGPAWRRIWNELGRLVENGPENANNRFAVAAELNFRCTQSIPGPLWGRPAKKPLAALSTHSPPFPFQTRSGIRLERYRLAERLEPKIQSVWKIMYPASVGGQTLMGIPAVAALRDDPWLRDCSRIWPFETGFTEEPIPAAGPAILHAEIWPGAIPEPLDRGEVIRDRAQVRAAVAWLRRKDTAGELRAFFGTPAYLSPADVRRCIEEEGWILGAGAGDRR
jgi:hypothetical protein